MARVIVELLCAVGRTTGLGAIEATQRKIRAGNHCLLEGTAVDPEIKSNPRTEAGRNEIVARLERCPICSLKPAIDERRL